MSILPHAVASCFACITGRPCPGNPQGLASYPSLSALDAAASCLGLTSGDARAIVHYRVRFGPFQSSEAMPLEKVARWIDGTRRQSARHWAGTRLPPAAPLPLRRAAFALGLVEGQEPSARFVYDTVHGSIGTFRVRVAVDKWLLPAREEAVDLLHAALFGRFGSMVDHPETAKLRPVDEDGRPSPEVA
jgi:hypothetical protein